MYILSHFYLQLILPKVNTGTLLRLKIFLTLISSPLKADFLFRKIVEKLQSVVQGFFVRINVKPRCCFPCNKSVFAHNSLNLIRCRGQLKKLITQGNICNFLVELTSESKLILCTSEYDLAFEI